MKLFKWIQNRLNGSNGKMKPSSISATHYMLNETYKQEFRNSDQTMLAIGTFGNKNLKEDSNKSIDEENSYNSFRDCTKEFIFEVENLQNLIYSKGSRECLDKSKNGVSKKSLFFLLKKMFKDPLSTESRMEKILRAILNKNIHPHPPHGCSTTYINKYLENDSTHKLSEDEYVEKDEYEEELTTSNVDKGCKWVKTDSEYIVLEI